MFEKKTVELYNEFSNIIYKSNRKSSLIEINGGNKFPIKFFADFLKEQTY